MIAVEEWAIGRHVIEDTIQHDLDAKLIGVLREVVKIFLRAKIWINFVIVLRVIAMIRA